MYVATVCRQCLYALLARLWTRFYFVMVGRCCVVFCHVCVCVLMVGDSMSVDNYSYKCNVNCVYCNWNTASSSRAMSHLCSCSVLGRYLGCVAGFYRAIPVFRWDSSLFHKFSWTCIRRDGHYCKFLTNLEVINGFICTWNRIARGIF